MQVVRSIVNKKYCVNGKKHCEYGKNVGEMVICGGKQQKI